MVWSMRRVLRLKMTNLADDCRGQCRHAASKARSAAGGVGGEGAVWRGQVQTRPPQCSAPALLDHQLSVFVLAGHGPRSDRMLLSPSGGSTAASDAAMACGSIPRHLFGMHSAVDHDRQACGPTPCWKSWTVGAAVYDRLGQAVGSQDPRASASGVLTNHSRLVGRRLRLLPYGVMHHCCCHHETCEPALLSQAGMPDHHPPTELAACTHWRAAPGYQRRLLSWWQ